MTPIVVRLHTGTTQTVRPLFARGVWVVHRSVSPDTGYTVTHAPTGLAAALTIQSLAKAKRMVNALLNIPGDWSFTDEGRMSRRQKRAAKRVKNDLGIW